MDYWKERSLGKEYYNDNEIEQIKIACIFLQVHFIKFSKSQSSHNRGKFGEVPSYENWKVAFFDDDIKQAGGIASALENEMWVEMIGAISEERSFRSQ